MRYSWASLVLALTASVQSIVVPRSHVLHEKRDTLSRQWVKREKLSPSTTLPMRIGLTQQNLEDGYKLLMDVSHPDSENYGKHWTSEEVIKKFAPSHQTVQSVKDWLNGFGIGADRITHSDNRGWIAFDATVEEADSLLATEFHSFEHEPTGASIPGCDSYHVPKHIQKHVDYITPGVKLLAPFGAKDQMSKRGFGASTAGKSLPPPMVVEADPVGFPATAAGPTSTCDKWISPECVRALYNVSEIPEYPNGVPREDNAMGLFESGDFYSQNDLNIFFKNFTPKIPQDTAPTPAFIDGAIAPVGLEGVGAESGLDFMLAYPLLYPQKLTLYQTDDYYYTTYQYSGASGGFNTFLDAIDGSYCTYSAYGETGNDPIDPVYPNPQNFPGAYKGELMCGVYKPTNVISVSYGGQEYDLPAYYQYRQCNEFLKLGLQGVSIFFASGDSGVAGPVHQGVTGRNGCLGSNSTIFTPTWPNNCPYVTNVGATKVYPGHSVHDPESAANDLAGQPYRSAYSSGGGFSNIYGAPDYQKDAIEAYFANFTPKYPYYIGNLTVHSGDPNGVYNRVGRGIPDVSANGDNIATIFKGVLSRTAGTSASTPIFASLVNRINEQRLNAGKSTLGFMNPALYLHPEILNDITNGTNPGCGTEGFKAVPGWDPVTGLGTPNYPKMLAYFMSLP